MTSPLTLCEGKDLAVCDRCRHYAERSENAHAAELTKVRMKPMIRNEQCVDAVLVPSGASEADREDRL